MVAETPTPNRDLEERLDRAAKRLLTLAEEAPLKPDRLRLQGKAEGVRLALSYLREERRRG